jgi:hypothetical protein
MSGKTKRELANDKTITNQQALVEALLGNSIALIRRPIAGGKRLLEFLDKENTARAVFNWLRGCGGFTEVTISFAKNPEIYAPVVKRFFTADGTESKPFWDKAEGRKELANRLADILLTQRIVSVTAKHNGIYIAYDSTGSFAPTILVTEALQKRYPELEASAIGEKVPNPEWEPYIEFRPTNRSRYTIYKKD